MRELLPTVQPWPDHGRPEHTPVSARTSAGGSVTRPRDEPTHQTIFFDQHVVTILEAGIADGSFLPVASARVLASASSACRPGPTSGTAPGPMAARDTGRRYVEIVLDGLNRAQQTQR
ncbi:hypothetical protein [Pseudonocardia abyssalis]|uniref:Uncharacterized protein n=2 Tax=Pseudonocardiaceae TaxID=2070 RepID=A0ABS6V2I4_9PSEU|nr:hypothetical protein [Pseudonocardia abyssalis]MBW0113677.1 hypothetical protein [Pseudonocardia abyssalis]MBW0138358.1 hypothetical protein [Pseudonocardia abyssalis]